MMTFASYLAAFNARVQASRDRKDEQEREATTAKNAAMDAAAANIAELAPLMREPDDDGE